MAHFSVKDVDGHSYVQALAKFLKKSEKVKQPEWVDIVKLSIANEQAPYDPDWFYVRCAAVLRHLYLRPAGLAGLSKAFSRRKNNGVRPCHRARASTAVLRRCLHQVEAMGLCKKRDDGGREITSAGRRDMDRIAYETYKALKSQK
uniref:Small ribosomal subunit protein eS19 n=1 Tax=Schistocephalus solidus TaxID=70667 RepID=A0A0X3NYR9_SCHSO